MIWLGIDVSSKRLAIAGIRDAGGIVTKALELDPKARGARRLVGARTVAHAALGGHANEAAVIAVEAPIAHGANNNVLLGIAYVVMEAAQSACPGAVVMDVVPPTWRKAVLGKGNATKIHALDYADQLGYQGVDDDVAEALCVAAWGRGRWEIATREKAA